MLEKHKKPKRDCHWHSHKHTHLDKHKHTYLHTRAHWKALLLNICKLYKEYRGISLSPSHSETISPFLACCLDEFASDFHTFSWRLLEGRVLYFPIGYMKENSFFVYSRGRYVSLFRVSDYTREIVSSSYRWG